MFAFAIWDKKNHHLILARDRMGEKPLYFGWQGSGENKVFIFGSELKALKVHPSLLEKLIVMLWLCKCVITVFQILTQFTKIFINYCQVTISN